MITIYQKTLKDREIKTLGEFRAGAWVFVEAPTEGELQKLVADFSLDTDIVKDVLDPYEVPRFEKDGETLYLFTRIPRREDSELATVPFLIILSTQGVITVSKDPMPFLERFIKGTVKFSTTQKIKFILQIFFEINKVYGIFITDINRQVRSARINLEHITAKDIITLVRHESALNDFLSALVPMNVELNTFLSGKFIQLFEEDKDLVEDNALSTGQLIELGKANLKTIVNVRSAYSTIVTQNLNQIIKLLTALTVVLTIPTIIASLYGMNVALPFADSPVAFFGVLGSIFIFSCFVLFIFIWKRWL